jgi:hypothetical protein
MACGVRTSYETSLEPISRTESVSAEQQGPNAFSFLCSLLLLQLTVLLQLLQLQPKDSLFELHLATRIKLLQLLLLLLL